MQRRTCARIVAGPPGSLGLWCRCSKTNGAVGGSFRPRVGPAPRPWSRSDACLVADGQLAVGPRTAPSHFRAITAGAGCGSLRVMSRPIEDLRITGVRPLLPPAILAEEIPVSSRAADLVRDTRHAISDIIEGRDARLVVVVGPCSVHDPEAALDYAHRLKPLADRYADSLLLVLRCYFEKPRTTVGWKGLINDPELDGSFKRQPKDCAWRANSFSTRMTSVCRRLRSFSTHSCRNTSTRSRPGPPSERARQRATCTANWLRPVDASRLQERHRRNVQPAIDAVTVAASEHWFPGVTKQGVSAIFHTTGNPTCHVILRGGSRSGPNFVAQHVIEVSARLSDCGRRPVVMIDCSHGNSQKDHRRQIDVAASISTQVTSGSRNVFGVMIESHLVEGRQDYVPGRQAVYGQSITDACISIEQTEPILEQLAAAQVKRGRR